MKKITAIFLTIVLLLAVTACASSKVEETGATASSGAAEASAETGNNSKNTDSASESTEESESQGIEVDEGLLFVEITLPASYFEDTTEEEIKANADEKGITGCTINEDGSVTYQMTKAKHREIMQELADSVDEALEGYVSGENAYTSYKSIERNEDCSEFTIYVDAEAYEGSWDALGILGLFMYGGYYQIFDGVDSDDVDIIINVIDAETNEEISTTSYREWIESVNAE